ncbi:hypothetical protein BJP36_14940 [Moorena producens JHB]|uniref:Uncharacterized protein n=1 Tax=Moorena producens (strain JHB) TaxID=1454205 RepID=A0A1D9G046_MOOP1|nr:hypothetical protein [Moorena producens]AOY81002.1 hypothetical protein BJP36_14940 [Moorena producens JHB]
MNNNSLSLGKTLINTGLIFAGLTAVLATSANAESAIRGSAVETRASGSSISVSGELILPDALHFPGPLVVTPTYTGAGTNTATVDTLTLDGGVAAAVSATTSTSSANAFLDAAATALGAATTVEDQAALIRAGAANEGLGALE